jgi:hypothetical protein
MGGPHRAIGNPKQRIKSEDQALKRGRFLHRDGASLKKMSRRKRDYAELFIENLYIQINS